MAVQARLELPRVHLALADVAGARTLMREVDEVLKRRPDLGTLVVEAAALRGPAGEGAPPGRPRSIRPDRRLLPLLSTHLSFPEIAAELILSPYTIRAPVKSIYSRLDVS